MTALEPVKKRVPFIRVDRANCEVSVDVPSMSDIRSWTSSKTSAVKNAVVKPLARKRLILRLSNALKIAQDHQANGLPPGSNEYSQLHVQCLRLIDEYAADWDVDRHELMIQLPALGALERMAHPTPVSPKAVLPYIWMGAAAIFVLPILLGLASGLYAIVHGVLCHLFGVS